MGQPKVIPIGAGMPGDMRILFGKPEDLSIPQFSKVSNVKDRQVDFLRSLKTFMTWINRVEISQNQILSTFC